MQKQLENSQMPDQHGNEPNFDCEKCKDTGFILEKRAITDDEGNVKKWPNGEDMVEDVAVMCECKRQKRLKIRFENALIPSEFKDATLKNYQRINDVQQTLYAATIDYLKNFETIITNRLDQNSLGFIAVFGEQRIRQLSGSDKSQAKRDHNSFGLGKTHLQIAAAKWLMKNAFVIDEKSGLKRECRVLCVSDATFMDDLAQAKAMNDEGARFNELIHNASTVDVLVWDDLGKAKWSETKETLYYRIINERYRNQRPIIFSSNEDKGTLSEKIGYASASRLFGMTGDRLYEVEGPDYRLKKNKAV